MNANKILFAALSVVVVLVGGCATAPAASQPASPSQTAPLPDGIWEVELTSDELVAAGAPAADAIGGVYRWTFDGTRARITVTEDDRVTIECDADASAVSEGVRLEYRGGQCGNEVDVIQWAVEADGLHLSLVETNAPLALQKAYLETKPWQSVEGEATLTW